MLSWAVRNTSPAMETTGALSVYFLLYSGYDKTTKSMRIKQNLGDIFLVRKGITHTLDQVNKVLGLAGLSLLAESSFWHVSGRADARPLASGLATSSLVLLEVHAAYSAWRYTSRFTSPAKKAAATWLGVSALSVTLVRNGYGVRLAERVPGVGRIVAANGAAAAAIGLGLASAHFYTMELDSKNVLQVRPFGKAALVIGVAATLFCGYRAMQ